MNYSEILNVLLVAIYLLAGTLSIVLLTGGALKGFRWRKPAPREEHHPNDS
jgi:hypothetical protein